MVFGVDQFDQYLWGISFEPYTNHKPLLGPLGNNKSAAIQASPRVIRLALKLSTYKYELVYKTGKELRHADGLSRLPLHNDGTTLPRPAGLLIGSSFHLLLWYEPQGTMQFWIMLYFLFWKKKASQRDQSGAPSTLEAQKSVSTRDVYYGVLESWFQNHCRPKYLMCFVSAYLVLRKAR